MLLEFDLGFYIALIALGVAIFSLWMSFLAVKRYFRVESNGTDKRRPNINQHQNKRNQSYKQTPSYNRYKHPTKEVRFEKDTKPIEKEKEFVF